MSFWSIESSNCMATIYHKTIKRLRHDNYCTQRLKVIHHWICTYQVTHISNSCHMRHTFCFELLLYSTSCMTDIYITRLLHVYWDYTFSMDVYIKINIVGQKSCNWRKNCYAYKVVQYCFYILTFEYYSYNSSGNSLRMVTAICPYSGLHICCVLPAASKDSTGVTWYSWLSEAREAKIESTSSINIMSTKKTSASWGMLLIYDYEYSDLAWERLNNITWPLKIFEASNTFAEWLLWDNREWSSMIMIYIRCPICLLLLTL